MPGVTEAYEKRERSEETNAGESVTETEKEPQNLSKPGACLYV